MRTVFVLVSVLVAAQGYPETQETSLYRFPANVSVYDVMQNDPNPLISASELQAVYFQDEQEKYLEPYEIFRPVYRPKPIKPPRPKPRPKPHPKPRPKPHPKPRPKPYPKPHPKPRPKPHPKPRPKPHPRPHPKPRPKPHPKPRPKPRPKPHPKPRPKPHPKPHPKSRPKPLSKSHQKLKHTTSSSLRKPPRRITKNLKIKNK